MVLVTFQGGTQAVIFSVQTRKLAAKIDDAAFGFSKALWSPDGSRVLAFSESKVLFSIF